MSDAATIPMLRCKACGRVDTPGRAVCSGCLSLQLEPTAVAGRGTVATFTTIRRAPARFKDDAPYDVVVVDLAAGQRVTGRIAQGSAPPSVGAQVAALATADAPYILFEVLNP